VLKDLAGVTSIAITAGDPVALAKALAKYAKDNPEFTFKAGVVEGRVISIKEIEALATMPSKEEIYSKLLFLINAPAQRLVTAMNGVGRNLAVVVSQGVKEKKFKESAEAAS
jgi:large subunit ribosomal protein L10